jgi:uroporphyrinogen III methyltransferase / synthase
VSSAIAGPAYAGIPVTHRGYNSVLTIFTGHEDPGKSGSPPDFRAIAAASGTKIMLMGMVRLKVIAAELEAAGMASQTPVALVRCATTGGQATLVGKLADIAARAEEAGFSPPAVAIFGDVVGLREKLNWFESLPLFGSRIAVTRTRKQAGELVDRLRGLGADAFELPTIRIEPPRDRRGFYELVADSHIYDWIVFTSPNGVDAFFQAFFEIYHDVRDLGAARIAAIGPATSERVRSYRVHVDVQPEKYVAEEIIRALQQQTSVENLKFLLARAEGAREALAQQLTGLGAIVDEAIAYRTVPETNDVAGGIQRFREEGADMITFTSSSTVENFAALKLPMPQHIRTASIGPITSKTMRVLGLAVDVEAGVHDIPGLVEAIAKDRSRERRPASSTH